MNRISHAEHAHVYVTDLEESLEFYTEVMGLGEIARENDTVYLGCGVTDNYDLAITEGGTGLDHFAIRVPRDALDRHERELADEGVETSRHDDEPTQEAGVRFDLPSGLAMELVSVTDTEYPKVPDPAAVARGGGAPLDISHFNLRTSAVQEDAEFLRDVLGFKISDVATVDAEEWTGAFTRYGDFHHDLGHTRAGSDDVTLHHVGWLMANIEHVKVMVDRLARAGYELEIGIRRHYVGNNIFAYLKSPGGNRIELSAEMATLDDDTPTNFFDRHETPLSGWGDVPLPESFKEGS